MAGLGSLQTLAQAIDHSAADEADWEIVARARSDRRAFAPLYARYAAPIYRYCHYRLGNRQAAEDATSRVFTKALAALPRARTGSFRSWLFAVAHNEVTDAVRTHRADRRLEAAALVADRAPSPEEQALAAEGDRSVAALLARLPADQRRVVELRLAGLTASEVAAVQDRGLSAVKMAQLRAYARLRELLADGEWQEAHRGDR